MRKREMYKAIAHQNTIYGGQVIGEGEVEAKFLHHVRIAPAREKLALAEDATRNEQMGQAGLLAEEARVHAELAYAQAEEIKAREVNDEMQQSTATLETEMNRATGVPQ